MSKFKKGDRVIVTKSDLDFKEGEILTVDESDDYVPFCIDILGIRKYIHQDNLELIQDTQYTKLTPKVGDRFRVVKEIPNSRSPLERGVYTVDHMFKSKHWSIEENCKDVFSNEYLTTEYLEPIKEGVAYKPLECYYPDGETIKLKNQQPKQTIMQQLNNWQKKNFNADTKALYKAGYIGEDLTPTNKGSEANDEISFEKNMKELVERAKADIKEEEDKK